MEKQGKERADLIKQRRRSSFGDELRRRAELLLDDLADTDFRKTGAGLHELLHELHVHQIELELQNEELQRVRQAVEQSRQDYMRLYHDAPVGYVILDGAGLIVKANKTFAGMTGNPLLAINGKPFADYLVAEDQPVFRSRFRSFQKSPTDKQIDLRLVGPAGPRYVSVSAMVNRDDGSSAEPFSKEGLLVTIADVHERKTLEKQARERNQELEAILSGMSDGFLLLDADLRIRSFNRAAERLLGKDRTTVHGSSLLEVFPEARGSIFETSYRQALTEHRTVDFETFFAPHNEWYEVSASPFLGGLTVFFRIISERKKAEQIIVESERRFRRYLEYAPYGIFIANNKGDYRQVNPAACRLTGYAENELLTMSIADLVAPQSLETGMAHFQRVIEQGEAQSEVQFRCKGGEERWFSVSAVAVGDDRFLGFVEDIEERKRTEAALLASQRLLLLNHQIATIFLMSPEDRLFNDVLETLLDTFASPIGLFGYIDEQGDLVCPTLRSQVWNQCKITDKNLVFPRSNWGGVWGRALLEKRAVLVNDSLSVPEGHLPLSSALAVPIIEHDQVIGQFVLANKEHGYTESDRVVLEKIAYQVAPILRAYLDRLRRRELQQELEAVNRRLEKNESLARMAGAVAHNYNNMLTAILGNLEVALGDLSRESHRVIPTLHGAQAAARRLADLGSTMLIYLGQASPVEHFPRIELGQLLHGYVEACAEQLPDGITLDLQVPDGPVYGRGNKDMLHRLLNALFVNAVEAMADGGSIELTLTVVSAGDIGGGLLFPVGWKPSAPRYAIIRVLDTGHGISAENLERVFDPFFSLKFTGRGMGLPLALGILRMHQGGVLVRSIPGTGSVFKILLPGADDDAQQHGVHSTEDDRVS